MIASLHHHSIRSMRAPRAVLCSALLLAFVGLAAAQESAPQQYSIAPAQDPAAPAGAAPPAPPSARPPTPPDALRVPGRILRVARDVPIGQRRQQPPRRLSS